MELLDCTLRDGGYYTNWDFDRSLVDTYIESFNHLPVDYLEIGYRSNARDGYLGEYFYCPYYLIDELKQNSNKKLAIILNEKNITWNEAEELLKPCQGIIDLVRIAVNPDYFERSLKLGEEVKRLGFSVSFNIMYMSDWNEKPHLIKQFSKLNGLADYLYLVDSYGGVFPDDVVDMINKVKSNTDVKLGFHGHNNLEMALANTLTAIDSGIDIVDATITGMGRGAGNLKMELLLTVLNSKYNLDFEFNWLSKVLAPFIELQNKYEWGTNLPYMFSGANSIPQKQVMEWVTKRYYSFNSIIRALTNRTLGVKDNQKLSQIDFTKEKKYTDALIVGGGPNAVRHSQSLRYFLEKKPNCVIIHASSKNALSFQHLSNDQFFCLVGNEGHRLEEVFGDTTSVEGKCILPPYPRKMGTYVPTAMENTSFELEKVDFTNQFIDSHTALALQTALELNVNKIFITGYDGYSEGLMGQKEQELFMENEFLFKSLKNYSNKGLISLTPTKYSELLQDTVYSYL